MENEIIIPANIRCEICGSFIIPSNKTLKICDGCKDAILFIKLNKDKINEIMKK